MLVSPEQTRADADAAQVRRAEAIDDRVRSVLDVTTPVHRITVSNGRLLRFEHGLKTTKQQLFLMHTSYDVEATLYLHLGHLHLYVVVEDIFRYFSVVESSCPLHDRLRFLDASLRQQPRERLGDRPEQTPIPRHTGM